MKLYRMGFLGIGLLFLAGCATTKGTAAPATEARLQTLENRVQVLEAEAASSAFGPSVSGGVPQGQSAAGVTAESMTKKDIQRALKNAGYYDGVVDGKIGPKTKAAIMDFQKGAGLKADGITGRTTKEKLLKYLR